MSKSAKKFAGIVGLVVIGIATFGVGSAVIGGASLGGALGSASAIAGLSYSTLFSIGALALSVSQTQTLEDTGANKRGTPFADPEAHGIYAFGRTTMPSAVVYEEQHGSNENVKITDVFAHCWHEIEGYVSLHIGGPEGPEEVTLSGDDGSGDFAGVLSWFRADGSQSSALSTGAPNWPSTAVGEGVAHSAITWNVGSDAFKGKYNSLPQRLDILTDAAKLYDPREDNTYGSGSQDFDDPNTWTFPTNGGNAILVLLRMLRGHYSGSDLIWGRGAAEEEINLDNFSTMASVCDESLDGAFRFTIGGVWPLSGDWQAFVKRWEDETGGKLRKSGGVYHVWVPHDDLTAVTTITESDLLEGAEIGHTVASGIEQLYNTARGRYIEPDEGYRGFPYPEVSEATAVSDDEGKRILYQDFSWIQSRTLAERIVRLRVRRSRYQRVWSVPMGWKGQGPNYAPFTVHNLNVRETGNINQLVRVIDRRMAFNGATVLVLQEENAEIYDDTVPLGSAFNSDSIPARPDRFTGLTPRYVDGSAIDDLKPNEAGADVTAPRFTGTPTLINGDFELGTLEGWEDGGSSAGSITTATTFRGTYALRVDGGNRQRTEQQPISEDERLFVYHRGRAFSSPAPDNSARMRVRFFDSSNSLISTSSVWSVILPGHTSWQSRRGLATAPADSAYFRIEFDATAATTGAFAFDQVGYAIFPVDSDIDALETTNGPRDGGAESNLPGGSYVADPTFTRKNTLWEVQASDADRFNYHWGTNKPSESEIVAGQGIGTGSSNVLRLHEHDAVDMGRVRTVGRPAFSNYVNQQWVQIAIRCRKRDSDSLGFGLLEFRLAAIADDSSSSSIDTGVLFSVGDINGWTVDVWQQAIANVQVTEDVITLPWLGMEIMWEFDNGSTQMRIDIDYANMVPIADPT